MRKRFSSSQEGTSSVEFGLVAPLLVALLLGVADLGVGMFHKLQVQSAAQAGAQTAMTLGFNVSEITTAVHSATANTGIAAAPAPTNFCGCPSMTGIAPVSCSVSTCPSGVPPGSYVRVTATYTYIPLLKFASIPMTTQAIVRIR